MKKIVTVSGGTGGYNLLTAIKDIENIKISAIVCMTDDGGSTGILRDELGVLPPGDIRQCLTALSEESEILRKLMSYRFESGTLDGFSFGSILLAALEKVSGSFKLGLETAGRILKIKGQVIPILDQPATLVATLKNGESLEGEYSIYDYNNQNNSVNSVYIKEEIKINVDAYRAIEESDIIIIGPGDHFCSILPNLVVSGFKEAIEKTKAKIIYIVNLTNRSGHTLNWSANKYVNEIEKILNKKIDYIIFNNQEFTEDQIQKYIDKEGRGMKLADDLGNDNRVTRANLLAENIINKHSKDPNISFIRHDYVKLRKVLENLIYKI